MGDKLFLGGCERPAHLAFVTGSTLSCFGQPWTAVVEVEYPYGSAPLIVRRRCSLHMRRQRDQLVESRRRWASHWCVGRGSASEVHPNQRRDCLLLTSHTTAHRNLGQVQSSQSSAPEHAHHRMVTGPPAVFQQQGWCGTFGNQWSWSDAIRLLPPVRGWGNTAPKPGSSRPQEAGRRGGS